MEYVKCINCGADIQIQAQYCAFCGVEQSRKTFKLNLSTNGPSITPSGAPWFPAPDSFRYMSSGIVDPARFIVADIKKPITPALVIRVKSHESIPNGVLVFEVNDPSVTYSYVVIHVGVE